MSSFFSFRICTTILRPGHRVSICCTSALICPSILIHVRSHLFVLVLRVSLSVQPLIVSSSTHLYHSRMQLGSVVHPPDLSLAQPASVNSLQRNLDVFYRYSLTSVVSQ